MHLPQLAGLEIARKPNRNRQLHDGLGSDVIGIAYFKQIVQTDRIVACDDTGVTLLYPKVLSDEEHSLLRQSESQAIWDAMRAVTSRYYTRKERHSQLSQSR